MAASTAPVNKSAADVAEAVAALERMGVRVTANFDGGNIQVRFGAVNLAW
jgi:hypothetical protein